MILLSNIFKKTIIIFIYYITRLNTVTSIIKKQKISKIKVIV